MADELSLDRNDRSQLCLADAFDPVHSNAGVTPVVNAYISVKLLHISAILIWCAALLYLPGLLAAYSTARDVASHRRLVERTRLVYAGIASPAAVIAVLSGSALVPIAASVGIWLVLKLLTVAGLVLLHVYFGYLAGQLEQTSRLQGSGMHLFLLVPAGLLVLTTIYLVTGKPA